MIDDFFKGVMEPMFVAEAAVGGNAVAIGTSHHALADLQLDRFKGFTGALGNIERFVVVDVVKVQSRRVVTVPAINTPALKLFRRDVGPFFGERCASGLRAVGPFLFRVFLLPFFGAGHGFSAGQGLAFRVKLASTAVLGLLSSAVAEFFFVCHSNNVIRRKKWHNTITLQLRGTL